MLEFTIDLTRVHTFDDFIVAFNEGFCHAAGGHWHGRSWDAFNDYLYWPGEGGDPYRLILRGWTDCPALSLEERQIVESCFADNPHVEVVLQ